MGDVDVNNLLYMSARVLARSWLGGGRGQQSCSIDVRNYRRGRRWKIRPRTIFEGWLWV